MLYALLCLIYQPAGAVEGPYFLNHGSWPAYNLQVKDGMLSVCTPRHCDLLDMEGRLLYRIPVPRKGAQFNTSGYTIRAGVLYADVADGRRRWLVAMDIASGNLLKERRINFRNLLTIDHQLYGIADSDRYYTALIHQLDPETLMETWSFFKEPRSLDQFGDPTALWVVGSGDYTLVSIETDNRLYITNDQALHREKKTSTNSPGYHPLITLAAPGFIQAKADDAQETPDVMDTVSKRIFINQRLASTGRTLYFGKHERGFVYCYTVPDSIDSIIVGNHVAIQFYDLKLRPVGPLHHRFGQPAGLWGDELVILYPDGPEPLPDEAGVRVHYRTRHIESSKQLDALLKHFRRREHRVLQPVIERMPAPY